MVWSELGALVVILFIRLDYLIVQMSLIDLFVYSRITCSFILSFLPEVLLRVLFLLFCLWRSLFFRLLHDFWFLSLARRERFQKSSQWLKSLVNFPLSFIILGVFYLFKKNVLRILPITHRIYCFLIMFLPYFSLNFLLNFISSLNFQFLLQIYFPFFLKFYPQIFFKLYFNF